MRDTWRGRQREKGKSLHSTLQSQHQSGDYINTASSIRKQPTRGVVKKRGREERQRAL